MRPLLPLTFLLACTPKVEEPEDPFADVELHDPSVARERPGPLPEREFTPPETETRSLSNGLQVVVATNDKVPLVSMTLALRVGEYTAPTPGVAQATFAMLDKGAGDLDSAGVARKLKNLASSLSASAGDDGASISVSALKRNLEPTLDLMAKVLLDPTFPDEEWKILQMQYVTGIRNARKDPTVIARRIADRPLYGAAYKGRVMVEGDIERLTTDDLRAWYRTNVGPQNAIVLVGGDITADEAVALLEPRLGAWTGDGVVTPEPPPAASSPETETIFLVDKPGAAQTVIDVRRVVGTRTDEDWFPYSMGVDVLGGTFMSRLNLNLREDKGYTYGARCGTETGYGPSVLSCGASVQTEVTGPSIVEFRKELSEVLGDRPITDEELAYMKSTRVNQYPARFETPSALLGEQASIWRYGLPLDWPARYLPGIRGVEVAGASKALAERLQQGHAAWVVVGDKATILPGLQETGLPIVELDADGNVVKGGGR